MARRFLFVALAAGLCIAPLAFAQQGARPYKAPNNSFGHPDLGGSWTNATLTPTSRPARFGTRTTFTAEEVAALEGELLAGIEAGNAKIDNTKPLTDGVIQARGGASIAGNYDRGWFDPGSHVMRVGGEPRTSLITTPNGQAPARKAATAPAGRGAAGAGRGAGTDNPESLSMGDRCIISFGRNAGPPMLPNGFYNNNYQIVQGANAVAIMTEMVHDTRIIRLNATHRTDGVRPYFGDSIGWYEGDTLVVETINVPQRQAYNGSWEKLKVTERFRRVAPDRLLYQFTVEDPDVWDAPWGGEYEFGTLNGLVLEYACHEGNYALEGILAGARDAEEQARAR